MRRSCLAAPVAAAMATVLWLGVAGPVQAAPAAAYDPAVSAPREDPYYPEKGDPSLDALHYGLRLQWSARTRVLTGVARIHFRVPVAEDRCSSTRRPAAGPVGAAGRCGHGVQPPGQGPAGGDRPAGRRQQAHPGRLLPRYAAPRRCPDQPQRRPDSRLDHDEASQWTMQEPFGAYSWYPVNDHPSDKAFYDARIVAPRGMVGVFNGKLVARRQVPDGRTVTRWHLASPAASYLTTIAIGDYVRYRDRGPHGLPITYWLPRRDQRALPELRRRPS